jgi:hypothetical protein
VRRSELGQGRFGEGEPELKPWCHQWDSRFAGEELSCSSADRSVGSVSLRRSGATIQAKRIDHGESEVLRLRRGSLASDLGQGLAVTRACVLERSWVSTRTGGRGRWFSSEMGSRGKTRARRELVCCMIRGEAGEAGLTTARSALPWPASPTVLLYLFFFFSKRRRFRGHF